MNPKKELRKIKENRKKKIKDLFSRISVGGASVAAVIVITATAFAVSDFKIETFSNAIYFETVIEPTDFEVPEDADLTDPEAEIVFEEVELRMRLSSQFEVIYLPLTLYENKGKFTGLAPNTNYELSAQHYNGFQWVTLKSMNVRTKLENKASIIAIEESNNYTEIIRNLTLTIVAEAENPDQTQMYLEMQGKDIRRIPLNFGEHRYTLENIEVTDALTFKITYEITDEAALNILTLYEHVYTMLPYVKRILSLEFQDGFIIPTLDVDISSGLTFYMFVDTLNGTQVIENLTNVSILYTSQHRRLRIYGRDETSQIQYLIDTVDLRTFRPFDFVATIIEDTFTLTIIDPDERIMRVMWIDENGSKTLIPIGINSQVYVYEVQINGIASYQVQIELNAEYSIYYKLITKGATS
jgi:hypothetical protein